jgi:hypothetical protein
MNCEEYREAIAAEPSFDGGAGHLSECPACQAYRKEMLELDRTINRALSLDVPELQVPELPEPATVETGNVVALRTRKLSTPTWIAMAATVVLAAFVGFRMIGTGPQFESLGEELLAHIDHEPYALRVSDEPVSDARLGRVVPATLASLDHSAGLITYAQTCVVNGRKVPHLVIQGERGPVTILLMPEEMVSGPESVSGQSVQGVIIPVGNGSIAIFGEREEALERIERKVLESVSWNT